MSPTTAEARAIAAIKEKDRKLRAFLEAEVLAGALIDDLTFRKLPGYSHQGRP